MNKFHARTYAALHKSASNQGPCNPDAMDVDVGDIRALTQAKRQEYFKLGKCYNCGKQGHRAFKCPKKETGGRPRSQNIRQIETRKGNYGIGPTRYGDRIATLKHLLQNLSKDEKDKLADAFDYGHDDEDF